jgi:hypothetical protein
MIYRESISLLIYFRQRYWFDAKKIKGDWLQSDIKCIFKKPLCPEKRLNHEGHKGRHEGHKGRED